MKYSDDIFLLVKSLSKQEKSYFKKFATAFAGSDDSNYLKLFDELVYQAASGDNYDEEKVKKGNYTGKFLKNLSFHKNYLYNMILSAILLYHKENKEFITIRNLISQSDILFDKLLFDQSQKVLLRAKRLAEEKENYIYLFEILSREKLLAKYMLTTVESEQMSKKISTLQFEYFDNIRNNLQYSVLNDQLVTLVRGGGTGFVRSKEDFDELDRLFETELLKDVSCAKTFYGKNLFYDIKIKHCMINNDFEGSYDLVKKKVELWDDNIHKTGGKLDNYFGALNNLLTCLIRLKKFDEFDETEEKIKRVIKKYPDYVTEKDRVFVFYSLSCLKIAMYFESLNIEKLAGHEEEVQREIKKYEKKINPYQLIILHYFLGMANFVMSDFEKCIYWHSKIINSERTDLSQDYHCYARIVFLVSYFELGYFDNLEYALKSVYRFLSKKKRAYKYENIILQYLRRTFRLKSQKELDEMFLEMKFDLEKIADDPFEQNAFDAFNILLWLESKIKKTSLFEIMKSKRFVSKVS